METIVQSRRTDKAKWHIPSRDYAQSAFAKSLLERTTIVHPFAGFKTRKAKEIGVGDDCQLHASERRPAPLPLPLGDHRLV
jgi:hypothetical protein